MEETKWSYERLLNALEDLELLKKLPSYEEKGTDPLFEKVKGLFFRVCLSRVRKAFKEEHRGA